MSTNKQNILTFFLVLVVLGGVLFYIFLKELPKDYKIRKTEKETQEEQDQKLAEPKAPVNQSGVVIPEQVHSYQGKVLQITDRDFKITVSALNNFLQKDKKLTIRFDEKTVFSQRKLELQTNQDPKISYLPISVRDLKVGNQVVVITRQNVKNKDEFRAEAVRVIK